MAGRILAQDADPSRKEGKTVRLVNLERAARHSMRRPADPMARLLSAPYHTGSVVGVKDKA